MNRFVLHGILTANVEFLKGKNVLTIIQKITILQPLFFKTIKP